MGHILDNVCGTIALSANMKNRATSIYQGNTVKIHRASKEDLFLFKGITSREADLDDTAKLAQSGLNWAVINQECQSQSEVSGTCWEDGLYQTILGLKQKYSITSPIEKTLRKAAEQKLMEKRLLAQISGGNNTIIGIAKEMKMARGHISTELDRLIKKGLIIIDKSAKTIYIRLAGRATRNGQKRHIRVSLLFCRALISIQNL